MRINFNTICPRSYIAANNNRKNTSIKSLGADCFEKVSFGMKPSELSFDDKIKEFSNECKNLIVGEGFDFTKVQELITKYAPYVKVKPYEQIPKEQSAPYKQAICSYEMRYNEDNNKFEYKNYVLYIKKPDNNNIIERIFSYANLVHEFTHICQIQEEDKSRMLILNDWAKNHPVDDKFMNTCQASNFITINTETAFRSMTRRFVEINRDYDVPGVTVEDGIAEYVLGDTDNFFDIVISDQMSNYKTDDDIFDKELFYKTFQRAMEGEKEAYRNELIAEKDYYCASELTNVINDVLYSKAIEYAKKHY